MAPQTFAEPGDDPAFLAWVDRIIACLVERHVSQEVYLVRIANRIVDFSRSAVFLRSSSHSASNAQGSVMADTRSLPWTAGTPRRAVAPVLLDGGLPEPRGPPMDIRDHFDPDTGLPHLSGHGVTEAEAEYVLRHPGEERSRCRRSGGS